MDLEREEPVRSAIVFNIDKWDGSSCYWDMCTWGPSSLGLPSVMSSIWNICSREQTVTPQKLWGSWTCLVSDTCGFKSQLSYLLLRNLNRSLSRLSFLIYKWVNKSKCPCNCASLLGLSKKCNCYMQWHMMYTVGAQGMTVPN
jgi:hypothetical protein